MLTRALAPMMKRIEVSQSLMALYEPEANIRLLAEDCESAVRSLKDYDWVVPGSRRVHRRARFGIVAVKDAVIPFRLPVFSMRFSKFIKESLCEPRLAPPIETRKWQRTVGRMRPMSVNPLLSDDWMQVSQRLAVPMPPILERFLFEGRFADWP